jgi:hypothetical protein
MDGFLSHVEENCLTLCGMPFKKMDKKSEKNFLFSRKQQLISLLSTATNPATILEYTIMILFQQIRQYSVSGSLLRENVLKALLEEKKLPIPVATALKTLNDLIGGSDGVTPVDEALIAHIKDCGCCRDITKHDTAALEEYLATTKSKS